MALYNPKSQKSKRQFLRKNATSAEATLWKSLKKKQLSGRKFRRQHGIGPYIVDFYCPAEKLAIEMDGQYHDFEDNIKQDENKEAYLSGLGIQVLRFENKTVFEDLEYRY